MKRSCSKCNASVGEFDKVCHKCGHIFRNVTHHITQRPHQYHIIRDLIFAILLLLLIYWAFQVYTPERDITVTSPEVNVPEIELPEIVIPEQNISVNIQQEKKFGDEFERDPRLVNIEESYKSQAQGTL